MEIDCVTYVELYKLKAGLLKQIKELERLMEKAIPKDFETLNRLASNITLGVYDYPFNGILTEKIIFTLSLLKIGSHDEIRKYMSIVGDNRENKNDFDKELKETLEVLENAKMIKSKKVGSNFSKNIYSLT